MALRGCVARRARDAPKDVRIAERPPTGEAVPFARSERQAALSRGIAFVHSFRSLSLS